MDLIDGKEVNLEVATRDFKFYIFDWDDNILHMPTCIHLEKLQKDGSWQPVRVSTGVFAVVRNRPDYRKPSNGGWERAFREFQDDPGDGGRQFLRDTVTALRRIKEGEVPGPSFETMRRTLVEGRIFAIVTARGHASDTIRKAVKIFIDAVLSPEERAEMMANLRGYRAWLDKVEHFGTDEEELDYYLSMCRFHAVTNPEFHEQLVKDPVFGERFTAAPRVNKPEMAKKFAINDFIHHLFHILEVTGGHNHPISIGFSDDDAGNVAAVSNYIVEELSGRFPGVKFVVYDTSDPSLSKGRKITVSGQLDLPGF